MNLFIQLLHLHSVSASGHDASADSTAEVDHGNYAPNNSIPTQQGTNEESRANEILKKIKLEDLSDLLKDTRYAFFTSDSPQDEPITISNESEEEEVEKDDTHATSHDVPEDTSIPYELEQQKAKSEAKVASLKARPLYPNINQLIDLLVAELKNIQWELPVEFQALPSQVSLVQEKLKTLDSLPSLLNKVTDTLNRFATIVENASACQASASPAEGEKNTTKDAKTNLQNKLVDLLKSSKIINCDVLAQKGPILLKVYKEDGTIEVIANFKVSDLHLAEWREVIHDYPDRKEKRWKPIYGLIKTRMEYIDQTEKELKIDFNKPLKEQDPLNELNELANKKRKRTSYLKDHSSLCSGTKTKEGLWKELQFSLVDNSELNVVYLLNKRLKHLFHFNKVYKAGKRLLYVKRNKAISLRKCASKVGIEVQQLSEKDCTWYFRARLH
ncbi:hypothetical protein Tco_0134647 [Tanacetum coccineum]